MARSNREVEPKTLEARVRCPACGNVVGLMDSTPCARCQPNLRVPRPIRHALNLSAEHAGDLLRAPVGAIGTVDDYRVGVIGFRAPTRDGYRDERLDETHLVHVRDPQAVGDVFLGALALDRVERRQLAALLLLKDVIDENWEHYLGNGVSVAEARPIAEKDLVAGRWYWGGGRGGPCALWNGTRFLMPRVNSKAQIRPQDKDRWEIEVTSGGYGAFVPYVDVGQVEYGECLRHDPVHQEAQRFVHGLERERRPGSLYYVERDGAALPATFEEWLAMSKDGFPTVARTSMDLAGDHVVVSTKFFGTRWSESRPLAPYETRVFGGHRDGWSVWTRSRAEAVKMHEQACELAAKETK